MTDATPDWPPSPQVVTLFVRRYLDAEWTPIWAAQLSQFSKRPDLEFRAEEMSEGRWCPAGNVLIPESIEEAKMMNLVSEQYLRDHNAPAESPKE